MQNKFESIVKEGNYQVVKVQSPCGDSEMDAVIGFDDFDTARDIAIKNGLRMVYINKKSESSAWKYETDADAPIEVDINLFEDDENVRVYTDMWEEDEFSDDTLDIAEDIAEDKRAEFMTHRKQVWETISELGIGELVIVYDDRDVKVSKMLVTEFQTKHDHWMLALM